MTRPKLYKDKTRIQVVCETEYKEALEAYIKKHFPNKTMSEFVRIAILNACAYDVLNPNP